MAGPPPPLGPLLPGTVQQTPIDYVVNIVNSINDQYTSLSTYTTSLNPGTAPSISTFSTLSGQVLLLATNIGGTQSGYSSLVTAYSTFSTGTFSNYSTNNSVTVVPGYLSSVQNVYFGSNIVASTATLTNTLDLSQSTVSGTYASGIGNTILVLGNYSFAVGNANQIVSSCSFVTGFAGDAITDLSFVYGESCTSEASNAHAEGSETYAGGINSHTEGSFGTSVYAANGHAEGSNTLVSTNATAAHAEGGGTIASGPYSHAEGYYTVASGIAAHAEGGYTVASGNYSHAEGQYSQAVGIASHAEGFSTVALGDYSHTEGQLTYVSSTGQNSHAEGYQTFVAGSNAHAEGWSTVVLAAQGHAEGFQTIVSGTTGHAEGWLTVAAGSNSHAEGISTYAGVFSHSEGISSYVSGAIVHAEGNGNVVLSSYSHVEGAFNLLSLSSQLSHVEGHSNAVHAYVGSVYGTSNKLLGDYTHMQGFACSNDKSSSNATVCGFICSATVSSQNASVYGVICQINAESSNSHAHGQSVTISNAPNTFAAGLGGIIQSPNGFSYGGAINIVGSNAACLGYTCYATGQLGMTYGAYSKGRIPSAFTLQSGAFTPIAANVGGAQTAILNMYGQTSTTDIYYNLRYTSTAVGSTTSLVNVVTESGLNFMQSINLVLSGYERQPSGGTAGQGIFSGKYKFVTYWDNQTVRSLALCDIAGTTIATGQSTTLSTISLVNKLSGGATISVQAYISTQVVGALGFYQVRVKSSGGNPINWNAQLNVGELASP